jgi:hypothetical protein
MFQIRRKEKFGIPLTGGGTGQPQKYFKYPLDVPPPNDDVGEG